jgi:murein tripeptide amidase MpaA
MLITKIHATREELRLLEQSPVFVQRRHVRRLDSNRFEVRAVMEPFELSLLEIKGYDIAEIIDASVVLKQRLRRSLSASPPASGTDLFNSVASNESYMTVEYIDRWLTNLAETFPLLVDLVLLPNLTWEGRQSYAVHVRTGDGASRPAIVFTSGVHAGELGGPDACIYFLYRLINAYSKNDAVALGNYSASALAVQNVLNSADLYVFPCVNPDGRAYVFESQDWWRKNRNPNVGMHQVGVDINRNYDFLWSTGIGSSMLPQDDTYRGSAPFSEPETRNVDWLLKHAAADQYMDIHGPLGTIVYSWGDAADQSNDPSMNFANPAWDGRRFSPYSEYLSASDRACLQQTGGSVEAAVNAVRTGHYVCGPSYNDIYPTTATSDDYSFSRHLTDAAQSKTYGYTFEYGGDYFPPYEEMLPVISETNAAMLQFCMAAMTTS